MGRIIPYIMENNICSKPPTRLCIDIWWEVMSDDVRSFLHDLHYLTLHAQSEFTRTDVAKMTRASRTTKPQKGQLWSTIRNLTVFSTINWVCKFHRPLVITGLRCTSVIFKLSILSHIQDPFHTMNTYVCGLKTSWLSSSLQNSY